MRTITSPGSIKSLQSGAKLVNGAASDTVTITAVDTAKTVLALLGSDNASDAVRLILTNTTTITINRSTAVGSVTVNWQATEYY